MANALKRARTLGGLRRAELLTPERRSAIASLGGLKRARSLSAARKLEISLLGVAARLAKPK